MEISNIVPTVEVEDKKRPNLQGLYPYIFHFQNSWNRLHWKQQGSFPPLLRSLQIPLLTRSMTSKALSDEIFGVNPV